MAESKSLVIQADVMQRELESCLRREYSPENVPLLPLQVKTHFAIEKHVWNLVEMYEQSWLSGQDRIFSTRVVCRTGFV